MEKAREIVGVGIAVGLMTGGILLLYNLIGIPVTWWSAGIAGGLAALVSTFAFPDKKEKRQ